MAMVTRFEVYLVQLAIALLHASDHVTGIGYEGLVQGVGLELGIRIDSADSIRVLRVLVHDGQLTLLVNGELGVHKALVAGIGLLDISQVPFANM